MEASREMKMQKCDVSTGCKLRHGAIRVAELASELCLELWRDSCELHRQHLSCRVMESYVILRDMLCGALS
jgi:hypothetical protein